jgi:hypothetical protein
MLASVLADPVVGQPISAVAFVGRPGDTLPTPPTIASAP